MLAAVRVSGKMAKNSPSVGVGGASSPGNQSCSGMTLLTGESQHLHVYCLRLLCERRYERHRATTD
jgi:hypothetical protein